MSAEIPGFSQLEAEFHQRLVEERAIREQLQGARQVALEAWEQMEQARQFALEDILKESGLGICSYGSMGHGHEETEQEQLGILPRQQLSYLYVKGPDKDDGPGLYSVCTSHYQYQNDLRMWRDSQTMQSRWFFSEVENKGGRFITVIGSIDVTDMPLQYQSRDMGKVFQYFNFPKLPPKPIFPA